MLKASFCRRCGSTQAGHTCKSVRPAAAKACKRMAEGTSDGTDSDPVVDLCGDDDDDDVFVKQPKAKKQRASDGSTAPPAAPAPAPPTAPAPPPPAVAAAPVASASANGLSIMTAMTNYVSDLEQTIADLRSHLQTETATRLSAELAVVEVTEKLKKAESKRKSSNSKTPAAAAKMPAVFTELIDMVDQQFMRRKVELEEAHQKASTAPMTTAAYAFRYLNESGMWVQLPSNAAVEQQLTDLCNGVSPRVTYTATNSTGGSNTYDAVLDSSPTSAVQGEMKPGDLCIEQTNSSHHAHTVRPIIATPGGAVSSATPRPVVKDLLYGDPVVALSDKEIDQLLAKIDANEDRTTAASAELATLATNWSALASQHTYSASHTMIWSNPTLLKQWLETAKVRKLGRARIVMHGSGDYESLRTDPMCYNMLKSQSGCARGPGFYVSVSDHIPRDYNGGAPMGTGLLGLMLCGDDSDEGIETVPGNARVLGQGNNVHIFTRYKLGASNLPNGIRTDVECKEAIRILDLSRFIPLGLAHAA